MLNSKVIKNKKKKISFCQGSPNRIQNQSNKDGITGIHATDKV